MNIRFLGNHSDHNPANGLCDEYRLDGVASLDDLLAACRQLCEQHPDCKPLLSLDDLPQARYTAGHARLDLDLGKATPEEQAGLPPECFENGEYPGYLNTKAEFPIALRNFLDQVAGASFAEACNHGLTLTEEALQEWLAFQQDPVALIDQPASLLAVPVADACEALVAFPNGYFECDLGPAQNFAVARHLGAAYGYELVGVGAAYLGFLRSEPADATLSSAIAQDLCAFYNVAPAEWADMAQTFVQAIVGRTWLSLRYVE
ncbi:hypothetical protein [uncultured Pseudomonas sp.]|uniref:hypothetical protein n=1 Tax=uncultured Pseudomonas sp. TaxID=114707 RepID=UPI0025FFF1B2|nr:hypothetical protein [uncultured Pseudomonas sp.]